METNNRLLSETAAFAKQMSFPNVQKRLRQDLPAERQAGGHQYIRKCEIETYNIRRLFIFTLLLDLGQLYWIVTGLRLDSSGRNLFPWTEG